MGEKHAHTQMQTPLRGLRDLGHELCLFGCFAKVLIIFQTNRKDLKRNVGKRGAHICFLKFGLTLCIYACMYVYMYIKV